MLSNKPYLIRAFFQWIVDSTCTPILVIDATHPRCKIPAEYVESGEIVFNISSTAVRDLKITNEVIEFKASFSGIIYIISAPIKAILAVYAEENGEGIFFDAEEDDASTTSTGNSLKLRCIDSKSLSASLESGTPVDIDMRNPSLAKSKPILTLVE